MARISIDRLARPEEEDLSASQAGKVVGAGLTVYNPYTGITTYGGFGPTLGPGTFYNSAFALRPPVYYGLSPYVGLVPAPYFQPVLATPVVPYYGW